MPRASRSIVAVLVALVVALGAPAAAPFAAGAAEAATPASPAAPGLARVWFLRQFEPSVSLRTPMIFVNGAALASSLPGTAFYRDFAPGRYTFSVETCTQDFNQAATLDLAPGSQTDIEIQALSDFNDWDCPADETFYARVIPAAWAERYLPQLGNLGAR